MNKQHFTGSLVMQKNLIKHGIQLAVIALALVAMSASASAFWPYHGIYAGWYGDGCYSNYSQESIPYFALHPPVYYSYPVARTYGLYPFPYFADDAISQRIVAEPRLVLNRFVDQKTTAESITFERQPLRIFNPYFEGAAESQSVRQANWETPKKVQPKVIYPIKLTSTP